MFKNVDFFFGGMGKDAGSMGNEGSLRLGLEDRSFWSSSTISIAVRVRVRLWVGAIEEVAVISGKSDFVGDEDIELKSRLRAMSRSTRCEGIGMYSCCVDMMDDFEREGMQGKEVKSD